MHILQHTLRGAIYGISEIGSKAVVPRHLKIGHAQIPRDQGPLKIIAQHDMQVVLHLIGLCPDMAAMHPVHGAIECLFIGNTEIAEPVPHPPIEPATKRPAAPQLVLVNPALALMHAHRHPLTKRGQAIIGVDPLLIAGVPDFVDGGIETVERVHLAHPRRDAHIIPAAGAERMHRQIQSPPAQIIAKDLRQFPRQRQLRGAIECALQLGPLHIQRRPTQRHQPRPHLGEHRIKLVRAHPRLVILEQRIIERAARRQRRRFLALEPHHFGQHGRKGGIIIRRPRLGPLPLRPARKAGQRHRQISRHLDRPLIIPPDMAQLRPRHRLGCLRLGLRQHIAPRRVHPPRMQHRLNRTRFLGPLIGGPARHHGFLIPAQPPGHLRQGLRLALARHQIVIGAHAQVPRIEVARGYWLRNRARRINTQRTTATN